jgi:hypothetical protein
MTDDAGGPTPVPWRRVVTAVALHPGLWISAAGQGLRFAPRRWWRRWPPLPAPDPALWRFRMETAYGGEGDEVPSAVEVRAYLRWYRERFGR